MVGAIQSSTNGKSGPCVQSAMRRPNELDKPNSRDEETFLAFVSENHSDSNGEDMPMNEIDYSLDSDQSIEALQVENAELKCRLAALEAQLKEPGTKGEDWGEQDREFARMMEEKTDVIRELHLKIQALQVTMSDPQAPPNRRLAKPIFLLSATNWKRNALG